MKVVEELFTSSTIINPEDVQVGDWIMIESDRGIVIHRVTSVKLNDGVYDIDLYGYNIFTGASSDTLRGDAIHLLERDPLAYSTATGTLMVVTTEKFSEETLVVRSPENHWIVIDKDYPNNFTEPIYDSQIITYRDYVEEDVMP